MKPRILSVCLNPTMQRTLVFESVAMGEVNRAIRRWVDASGKGVNVARVAAQLGAEATHLTHSGGSMRELFFALCAADGIRLVAPDSRSEIRTCVTVIDIGQGRATELVEESEPVGDGTDTALREAFAAELARADALVVSGSRAPGYEDTIFPWMTERALERGAAVVLDLRGKDLVACLEAARRGAGRATLVAKPNKREFLATFDATSDATSDGDAPGNTIHQGYSLEELVREQALRYSVPFLVTDGPSPAVYCNGASSGFMDAPSVLARNPIGSGDACAAGIACALASGATIVEAFQAGLRCGSMNAATYRPGSIRG
jgi:fructose-1-phosphate kinase PfkB-like protein